MLFLRFQPKETLLRFALHDLLSYSCSHVLVVFYSLDHINDCNNNQHDRYGDDRSVQEADEDADDRDESTNINHRGQTDTEHVHHEQGHYCKNVKKQMMFLEVLNFHNISASD